MIGKNDPVSHLPRFPVWSGEKAGISETRVTMLTHSAP
jgi:hypothetical protein